MSNFLFAWGSNQHRQCLNDEKKIISWDYGYDSRLLMKEDLKMITCGSSHSVILTNDGDVYGWGNNNFNQLGSKVANSERPNRIHIAHTCLKSQSEPEHNKSVKIKNISCGGLFTIFITNCGCIVRYGAILGDVSKSWKMDIPFNFGSITKVSCGQYHAVLLLSTGHVACFGRNMYGQIGVPKKDLDNNSETVSTPRIVTNQFVHRVVKIATGSYHTLCVDEINRVFCWGYGTPCGISSGHIMQPSHLPGLHEPLLDLVGGSSHSLFLTETNKILALGSNEFCQAVPESMHTFIDCPTEIEYFTNNMITNIYCNENYSVARDRNDTIFMWGKNNSVIDSDLSPTCSFKEPQKVFSAESLENGHSIISLSCGTWHIVCYLSSKINDSADFEDGPISEVSSSDESNSDTSKINKIYTYIEAKRPPDILKRERTFTTLRELYSKTPEPKSDNHQGKYKFTHVINLHGNNSREFNLNPQQQSTQSTVPKEEIEEESNSYSLNSVNNNEGHSQCPKLIIPKENIIKNANIRPAGDIYDRIKTDNCNHSIRNNTMLLGKSKTELVLPIKIKRQFTFNSMSTNRGALNNPTILPRLINLSLDKENTFHDNGTCRFGNKIKAIIEKSKKYCKENKL